MTEPAVAFEHVTKRFPGVVALEDVTFSIAAGSCHALCGENGAGKSTLGKILAGIYTPDAGLVRIAGQAANFTGPTDALAAGVAMVHQELAFCDNLSVAENLCLSSLPATSFFVSKPEMRRRAEAMLSAIGADIDVRRPVATLTIGQQQMLQIAGAVGRGARIIVFDEPTSSLSQHEVERLYALMARLRETGVTCVYVSHRFDEIFRLCDTVTVLRDGRHVQTLPIQSVDRSALVEMMIGRRVNDYFPAEAQVSPGAELMRVEGLSSPVGFDDIGFSVSAGEVVGFAGLVGAGRSEVAHAIFGLDPRSTGRISVAGKAVHIQTPRDAIALGIGLVPEDRKRQGLVLSLTTLANATLPILTRLARFLFLSGSVERDTVQPYFERFRLKAVRGAVTAALSGGNQQKVVLAKWLAARCRILILDEPTRGIDVGAKAEIHALIDELAASGTGVVLISSEMPEVLNLSSRIVVFRSGRMVGELARKDASQEALMRLMAGVQSA